MIFKPILKKEYSKVKQNGALHYAIDKAIYTDTFNMSICESENPKDDKIAKLVNREMKELQELHGIDYNNRKYYHFTISPEEENVNIETLNNMAKDFLQEFFPNGQASISIHNDNGRNHCHIILNSVMLNNRMIEYNNKQYDEIKTFIQEDLAEKYNLKQTTKEDRQNRSQSIINDKIDKARNKKGSDSEKSIIQEKIYNILENENITSFEDFKEKAKENGIEIETYKAKNDEIKLSYKTENLKYGVGQDKLGTYFEYRAINQLIQDNEKKKEQNIAPIEEKQPPQTNSILDNELMNELYNKAMERKEKEEKIKAEKLAETQKKEYEEKYKLYSEIWDKVEESPMSKNDKNAYFKKLNYYLKDDKREHKVIIKDLTSLLKAVIQVIKEIIEQSYNNNNTYERH